MLCDRQTFRPWQCLDSLLMSAQLLRTHAQAAARTAVTARRLTSISRLAAAMCPGPVALVESHSHHGSSNQLISEPSCGSLGSYHDDIESVLFSEEQLRMKIAQLGAALANDYAEKSPLILGVSGGGGVGPIEVLVGGRAARPLPTRMRAEGAVNCHAGAYLVYASTVVRGHC